MTWEIGMFLEIGIHKQQKDSGVEKLSNENTVRDQCQLFTVGVFSNPLDEFDNHHFKNLVDSNDEECNTLTHNL